MVDEKEIRARILIPLKRLAAETGVAVLGIMHLNKKVSLGAINRVGGAMGFVGVARVVWMFLRDQEDPDKLFMLQVKANITKNTKGLAFEAFEKTIDIGGESVGQPVIRWMGPATRNVNQQLSGGENAGQSSGQPRGAGRPPAAAIWLRAHLADGAARPLADILKAARLDGGYVRTTIWRARDTVNQWAKAGQAGCFKIIAEDRPDADSATGQTTFWRQDGPSDEVNL
jgi:hypothetical protein